MYAWEESFEKRILDIRNQELEVMSKREKLGTCLHLIWTMSPFMVDINIIFIINKNASSLKRNLKKEIVFSLVATHT